MMGGLFSIVLGGLLWIDGVFTFNYIRLLLFAALIVAIGVAKAPVYRRDCFSGRCCLRCASLEIFVDER